MEVFFILNIGDKINIKTMNNKMADAAKQWMDIVIYSYLIYNSCYSFLLDLNSIAI